MLNEIFQFTTVADETLENILNQAFSRRVSTVMDLEDGIQDVIYVDRTPLMKAEHRNKIITFFHSGNYKNTKSRCGFRVNSIRGNEFVKDLQFLKVVSTALRIRYLVVPKIESRAELEQYEKAFLKNGIVYSEIIPIIETVGGYNNVVEIFSEPATPSFHRAFWGHHDYNLDAGIFPFMEHQSEMYWKLTQALIDKLETAGYHYINGAFLELNNDEFFRKIIAAVAALCKKDFDVVALSYRQVKLLDSLMVLQPLQFMNFIAADIAGEQEKWKLANATVQQFKKNQSGEKSFSLDSRDAIIISPQQFLGAVRCLNQARNVHD